ncbi:MAG: hypothetical protein ABSG43_10050, partial [Solirubrobacteraceae bacterium]
LAGAVLAAAGLGVLAQLVGGLALVPLALAIYICLLPPRPWRDEDGGGDFGGDGPLGGGLPPDGPTTVIDWAAFERQFWSYVEQHPLSTT